MQIDKLDESYLNKIITAALDEDINTGDITTDLLIPENKNIKGVIIAKADGVIAGLEVFEKVFTKLDEKTICSFKIKDGDKVSDKQVIAEIRGSYRALLTGERTALNFLQRMSGIATVTSKFVEKLKGTNTKLLDTRKTVPGLRLLDKYSVKMGGGTNHRIGLYDMVMIKENHIRAAGSITEAIKQIRAGLKPGIKIEVETTNLDEVKEALLMKPDIIMLDNMSPQLMKEAVGLINKQTLTEASGSINLGNIRSAAEAGVDYISVGAITHSVKALDISMLFEK